MTKHYLEQVDSIHALVPSFKKNKSIASLGRQN